MDAKVASRRTGFGVTDKDRKKGIYSIEAKLESQCPLYSRMDKLFGAKPNIVPLGEMCMNQTNYIRGIDGFDDNEDEEEGKAEGEEEEEEEQEVEESEREEHEAEDVIEGEGDEEQRVDDGENIGTIDEPSETLQTLAAVAVNRIEAGSQAFQSIDLERSGNYTFGDDNYEDMFDNNNNYDLGPEEEEAFSDDNKENEPIQEKSSNLLKRPLSSSETGTPAKKVKNVMTKSTKELATVGKSGVTDPVKNSKAKDPRKNPPTLVPDAVPQSRNAFAAAFLDASNTKIESKDQHFSLLVCICIFLFVDVHFLSLCISFCF